MPAGSPASYGIIQPESARLDPLPEGYAARVLGRQQVPKYIQQGPDILQGVWGKLRGHKNLVEIAMEMFSCGKASRNILPSLGHLTNQRSNRVSYGVMVVMLPAPEVATALVNCATAPQPFSPA